MGFLLLLPTNRLALRFTTLFAGLLLYGISIALLVEAALGLDSWDVFHQGLAERTGISLGTIVIIVSGAVLVLWLPLGQRLGLGTIANAIVVGLALDASLALLPSPEPIAARAVLLILGIVLNGVATGLYIGAGLGPGPRDGLMTGLATKGISLRLARTSIELTVLFVGWLLGGSVGVGTVAYAVSIGPLAQFFLPLLTVPAPAEDGS